MVTSIAGPHTLEGPDSPPSFFDFSPLKGLNSTLIDLLTDALYSFDIDT
jgi:hypothetical protein